MTFGWNVLWSAVAVVALVTALFGYAASRKRFDLIDSFWGPGFAVIAALTYVLSEHSARALVVAVLTVVWGVRLGWHIHSRNRRKPEDQRYVDMYARAKGNPLAKMYRVYLLQAAIMLVVSLPVQFAAHTTAAFGVLDYLGVAVWLVGFAFESIGDYQLERFKADPASKGQVMDRGLWRYTRHPNYFGDACVWWGLFLFACSTPWASVLVVSPLLMTFLLAKGSGKPLLEKDIAQRRPGYAEYVRRTSGFFPLPPKAR
ncbi:DUF1295 domain-containing protein [Actinosynnema sp. NPDC047251]|uniref:Uncharacterized protein n=1 Tax=Saccharothrix espanaensis (strain ATCC 51144 / DSM 44229 / JCM 9112 / NBRC 15066 / NRRL 15764) TaxID=1179773 RepID=K0KB29_SACES|nr:DUF1295 domain-containing protein [Saccharothrix espanaensis]CCH34019.1 hypothetical protein BN6_67820 [Saccharothrix espanaensis DSM 44229]